MYRRLVLSATLIVAAGGFTAGAAESELTGGDRKALGDLNQAYADAFNEHDPQKVAGLFVEDGDYLIITGDLLRGRRQIAAGHASFFKNNPRGKIEGKQLTHRRVAPSVVLAIGEWKVTNGPTEFPSQGLWSAVQVKRDGRWRYSSVRLIIPVKPDAP
jgi:uncharacterized protein (TIGR02246 family)